ncbi:MAG: 5-deoxy-glucuronate isomerase [Eubacteriales bacterium]|nr:5-deoxy-glucuronate isomerase [Eubacteriales bacterium]
MHIRSAPSFPNGMTKIIHQNGPYSNALMDFGALRIGYRQAFESDEDLERAFLLVYGEVQLDWAGQTTTIARTNCFDESPYVLHVPAGFPVRITGIAPDSELSYLATPNTEVFGARLFNPADCQSEQRGQGTMNETATRIVRTVFDKTIAPNSNLALGEVITFPGKWSSYPPHHHSQPEIYFYKFLPENGFGYSGLGDEVCKVKQNSTTLMTDHITHPQVAAPGYAMWYLWAIRHVDNDPYLKPSFEPEHLWTQKPDAVIWPDKR